MKKFRLCGIAILSFCWAGSVSAQTLPIEFGTYLKFRHDNDFLGNDYGFTGSVDLEVGWLKENGWRYLIRYYSSLNSQRVLPYGNPNNPQYATFTDWSHTPTNLIGLPSGTQAQRIEQNSLGSLAIEHHPVESAWSWGLEAGLTQTESNSAYVPGAAGWQATLHHIVSATTEQIVSDGKKARYGVFVKPTLMTDLALIENPGFDLHYRSDLGGSFDTEGRRRFLMISEGIEMGSAKMRLDSRVESQLSALHKQIVLREILSLVSGGTTIFLGVSSNLTHTGYVNLFDTTYVDQDYLITLGFTLTLGEAPASPPPPELPPVP